METWQEAACYIRVSTEDQTEYSPEAQHRALEQDAAQIKTDRALTGALIERLIDRIEASHDKQITVRYRFQSEFETYAEVLEQCRNM